MQPDGFLSSSLRSEELGFEEVYGEQNGHFRNVLCGLH